MTEKVPGILHVPRKHHLLGVVAALLLLGFVATSLVSYLVSGMALRDQTITSGLPLTSDNIYSDLQNDLLPPILVSATMAQDTFLRDWAVNGEQDISKVIRYLTEIRSRNNSVTAFFVSDKTRNYYHPTGIVEQVTPRDVTDAWYFRFREMDAEYEVNADLDQANDFTLTIFINYKVFDYDDNFIGATGIGLEATRMLERIDSYEARYGRQIYFVNADGRIVLEAGNNNRKPASISEVSGLQELSAQVLNVEQGDWEYQRDGETYLLNTRYISELDWHLFVEQPESDITGGVRRAFFLSLGAGLFIAGLVVGLTYVSVRGYQSRLERMATTDNLTGIANRHSFELLVAPYTQENPTVSAPSSAIMFDLDHMKQVNDRHGHLTGDQLLKEVADLARESLRTSDVICRWGGEEFVIWLPGCGLEDAMAVAEKIRQGIHTRRFTDDKVSISASFGAVAHKPGDTLERTLGRADQAMYEAKHAGRDRVKTRPA